MGIKQPIRNNILRRQRRRFLITTLFLLGCILLLFWLFWRLTSMNMSAQQKAMQTALANINNDAASRGWVADYVQKNNRAGTELSESSPLGQWMKQEIT